MVKPSKKFKIKEKVNNLNKKIYTEFAILACEQQATLLDVLRGFTYNKHIKKR